MSDEKPFQTHRIEKVTMKKLRLICAYTGEQQNAVLDRLLAAELARVEQEHRPELAEACSGN